MTSQSSNYSGGSVFLQVVLHPTPNSPKQSELHKMTVTKACPDQDLKIKLAIRMDKPQNMKHCGWERWGGGVEEGGTLLWETLQWHSHVPFIFPVSSFHTTLGFLASFPVTLYGKTLYSALLPLVDIGVQFRRFVIREWKQALKILKATLIILHLCNHGSVAWLKKQNKLDPCQFSEHLFYFMSYILICALFNPGLVLLHVCVQCSDRYLWAFGKNVWKRWKKRFFVLVQVRFSFTLIRHEPEWRRSFIGSTNNNVKYCGPSFILFYTI